MSYKDASSPPPQQPPEVDPLPTTPGSNPPGQGDVDQSTWNTGVIVATILAAFVIGAIVWLATNIHPANNLPPAATGQGNNPPPMKK